jgi:hypothetical protein
MRFPKDILMVRIVDEESSKCSMTLPGLWAAQVSQLDPFFIIVTIPLFRDCPSLILEK